MFFDHRQTQACRIGDLLVASPITNQSRHFLFTRSEPNEMRQTGIRDIGRVSSMTAQIFALDQKMRLGQISCAELFQANRRAEIGRSRMTDAFSLGKSRRSVRTLRARPLLFELSAAIQDLRRDR